MTFLWVATKQTLGPEVELFGSYLGVDPNKYCESGELSGKIRHVVENRAPSIWLWGIEDHTLGAVNLDFCMGWKLTHIPRLRKALWESPLELRTKQSYENSDAEYSR